MSTQPEWKLPVQRPGQRRPDAGRGNSGQRSVPHSWLAGGGWTEAGGGEEKVVVMEGRVDCWASPNGGSSWFPSRLRTLGAGRPSSSLFRGSTIFWRLAPANPKWHATETTDRPPAIFWWSELPRAPAASRTSTAPAEPATAIVQEHGGKGASPDELPRARSLLT